MIALCITKALVTLADNFCLVTFAYKVLMKKCKLLFDFFYFIIYLWPPPSLLLSELKYIYMEQQAYWLGGFSVSWAVCSSMLSIYRPTSPQASSTVNFSNNPNLSDILPIDHSLASLALQGPTDSIYVYSLLPDLVVDSLDYTNIRFLS